jgi:membrane-associated phospholipid phosphatase
MFSWMGITKIGGSTIMLPAAVAIAVWLLTARAWRMTWLWCLLFGSALVLVAASKIVYVGWGIGIPALDFTGFSGHAMRSAAIMPPLCYLILQDKSFAVRMSGVAFGVGFAALISLSRVLLQYHSIAEALSGWLLGSAVCLYFIWRAEQLPKPSFNRVLIAASFVLLLAASFSKPIQTQKLIEGAAEVLGGSQAR